MGVPSRCIPRLDHAPKKKKKKGMRIKRRKKEQPIFSGNSKSSSFLLQVASWKLTVLIQDDLRRESIND